MLTQNSELRPHRIWNWTIPAWRIDLSDGSSFNACPSAGVCAQYCYARNGTYRFPAVLEAHRRNLEWILDDRDGWRAAMLDHLRHRKYRPTGTPRRLPMPLAALDSATRVWVNTGGAAVRIHDSGDFFADWYLDQWIAVARGTPDVLFYAYTKEIPVVRSRQSLLPANLRILFSTGGLHDHLIDPDVDRHADVFPDEATLRAAGYTSQDSSDLLAVLLPARRIGIPANNIPHYNKKLAGRRFSEAVPARIRMRGVGSDGAGS